MDLVLEPMGIGVRFEEKRGPILTSPELDLAVNRALARQPEARHASMGAFAAALRATLAGLRNLMAVSA